MKKMMMDAGMIGFRGIANASTEYVRK